jgi:hypothetical protein
MTHPTERDPDHDPSEKPMTQPDADAETPPHPSPAEGGTTESAPRSPHPSQPDGEREP